MLPSPSAPTPLSLSRCSPPPSRYRNTFSSSSSTLSSTALPYYMHLLGRDTASRGHRCTDAHSHARVAHSRTFARSRALSTDCLRSLVEFNDLSDRTVSLYLAPVDPRGLPLALSLPLSLSLFLHTRSRTEYRHVSRTPRHHRHFVSRSVSSCLSSFPSLVLLPSFSPTYRFLLLLYSPSLPPFLRHTFPPLSLLSVILRRSPLFLSFSLRFPHRRQCRAQRSRAAMRTTQMHASDCTTLDVNGLAREKKRVRRSVCERIAGVTDDSLR